MSDRHPLPNSDVTDASGYTVEDKVKIRNSNGWGGTQTQLPKGHLARRDTPARVKVLRSGTESE